MDAPRSTTVRPMVPTADLTSSYYLRFGVHDQPGVLGQLMTILGAHRVSVAQVVQDAGPHRRADDKRATDDPVWVVVLTHEAREGDVRAALAKINSLQVVSEKCRVIRIAS